MGEGESVCVSERVCGRECVWERGVSVGVCVCVREREWVYVGVCVCE